MKPSSSAITPHSRDITQMSRVDVFRDIANKIPRNDYGLPIFLYRPDLIAEDLPYLSPEDQSDVLATATVDIHYLEGFPTFSNSTSLWSQMEYEPPAAFRAFQAYLLQGETQGIRRLEMLAQDPAVQGVMPNGMDTSLLMEFHSYFFWGARCKAHDLFQQAAAQKMRERRVLNIQDQHFLDAEAMLKKVSTYFEQTDEESGEPLWLMEMTPKVALDYIDKLTKLQRISIGLPAHGLSNADNDGIAKNASVEVTLKQLSRQGIDPDATSDGGASTGLDLLLSDPETAAIAQQLVIKVGSRGQEMGDT